MENPDNWTETEVQPTALSPAYRAASRRTVETETVDVAVVGGGVTGAGVALDAVSRGLSVALFEATDFGAGTSGRSSKLLHGGLRYLERMQFPLVMEALRERNLQLTLAPHLAKPLPFLLPLPRRIDRLYFGLGVLAYDLLAYLGSGRPLPWHRHWSRQSATERAPGIRWGRFRGAVQYFDAQFDDARHTLELARTAATYGASVLNRARVVSLIEAGGRVSRLLIEDSETSDRYEVRARVTINAAGPWAGGVARLARGQDVKLRLSKGVHLLVERDRIELDGALIHRTRGSVLFIIPWGPTWLIGTTDTPWSGPPDSVVADEVDVRFLLDEVNSILTAPLGLRDVVGVFAGLRPLADDSPKATTRVSREHAIQSQPGIVTVTGGKYTTYRRVASDVVDVAVSQLPNEAGPSITAALPLVGADGFLGLWSSRYALARKWALPIEKAEHFLNRYGGLAPDVVQLASTDRTLLDPVELGSRYMVVEALYAVTHEGARTLEDVLARRTRVALESPTAGTSTVDATAAVMQRLLAWSRDETTEAVARYHSWVAGERRALNSDRHTRSMR